MLGVSDSHRLYAHGVDLFFSCPIAESGLLVDGARTTVCFWAGWGATGIPRTHLYRDVRVGACVWGPGDTGNHSRHMRWSNRIQAKCDIAV
jgi:hypothetical protein